MGASFRNIEQIKALAGLDKLTISPKLIEELNNDLDSNFKSNLEIDGDFSVDIINKENFNLEMSSNEMASTKLKEGIDKFITDTKILEEILAKIKIDF